MPRSTSNTPASGQVDRPPRRATARAAQYHEGEDHTDQGSSDSGGFDIFDPGNEQSLSEQAGNGLAKANTSSTNAKGNAPTLPPNEDAYLPQVAPTTNGRRRGIKSASEGLVPAPRATVLNADELSSYRALEVARPTILYHTMVGFA